MARFKADSVTEIIFDHLKKLSREEQELKISSLIFNKVDNLFISPTFGESISESERTILLDDINSERKHFPDVSSFVASINIFDQRYIGTFIVCYNNSRYILC